jgi:predicted phage terminase large subunit-like protein
MNSLSAPQLDAASFNRFRDAILRQDLASFIQKVFLTIEPGGDYLPNWHIESIAWHLSEVLAGRLLRLIITMPPRSLKSVSASVAFPAFVLGHDPTRRLVTASYSNDLAIRHANDCRAVLRSHWYRSVFPQTRLDPIKDTETEFTTTRRGYRLSTSIGGTLTGRGGDILIIDDPLKAADAHSVPKREAVNNWFSNTLLSRLDDKRKGAIVVVMQRVHQQDLVGHLLERNRDEWTVLSLPAISEYDHEVRLNAKQHLHRPIGHVLHAEREPRSILESLKSDLGSDLFSAQYQQAPVPSGGAMIKRSWIVKESQPPVRANNHRLIHSWDTASKTGDSNDWSVCTVWLQTDSQYHLIDLCRVRMDYPSLKRKALELAWRDHPNAVLIEDMGIGSALLTELAAERVPTISIHPTTDKVTRLYVKAGLFEAGRVVFPERAPWLADLEAELFSFPQARHDDQVDSISQALTWLTRPSSIPRIRSF